MASDKDLRALADRIGTFFDEDLKEMDSRLERIEVQLGKIKAMTNMLREHFEDQDQGKKEPAHFFVSDEKPEYAGDIEPSNTDEDAVAFGRPDPMPDDMPIGPGTTTDDIEAPEPIDTFKDEETVGSGQLAPDPSFEDAGAQEKVEADD